MTNQENSARVDDPAALAELARLEDLQRCARQVDNEIRELLAPLKDQLTELVLQRDRLLYEALAARQKFFQAVKKVQPDLEIHAAVHYEKIGEHVYLVWDDNGPRFLDEEGGELPWLHEFGPRRAGRRACDLMHWLS